MEKEQIKTLEEAQKYVATLSVDEKRDVAYESENKFVLQVLAGDEDEEVRANVAENATAPKEAFELLAKDESEWIQWNVAKTFLDYKYFIPENDVLKKMYEKAESYKLRELISEVLYECDYEWRDDVDAETEYHYCISHRLPY